MPILNEDWECKVSVVCFPLAAFTHGSEKLGVLKSKVKESWTLHVRLTGRVNVSVLLVVNWTVQ